MIKEISLTLNPQKASSEEFYLPIVARELKISPKQITWCHVKSRSIDARHGNVKVNLKFDVYIDEQPKEQPVPDFNFQDVSHRQPVVIVGAGPAGLFAALRLLQLGLKPIIIERGKDVHARKRDIAAIHRNQGVNPDSNYGFGEGGAGTYSDGKLFTRSKKRGNIAEVLQLLQVNGADPEILVDAHPHIGTDRLPLIIENIRNTILHFGGEVHFGTTLSDLILKDNSIQGVKTVGGETIETKAVILATGHSARDIYFMLQKHGVLLQAKSFAMGVRIEHPQELIDSIQYSCEKRGPYLPAAAYNVVHQSGGRGVYSFCMCPGGVIVPASTAPGEMVVNGMSPSMRNSKWANSGMVVEIRVEDVPDTGHGILNGLKFQMEFERLAFENGGKGQIAPAQLVTDFIASKLSSRLPETSFHPGVASSPMHQWMPEFVRQRLQDGFQEFGRKMKGFCTDQALLIGVESRTSSPVRILRDADTLQHPQIKGLYPCGEGAGYAGGIVSSAIDGQNCAVQISRFFNLPE